MNDSFRNDDPVLAAALEEFRRTPSGDAPARVLVSLLEKQAAARRRPRRGRAGAVVAVTIVALLGGFWVGRLSIEHPEDLRPGATVIENRIPASTALPDPPRIPFAAA